MSVSDVLKNISLDANLFWSTRLIENTLSFDFEENSQLQLLTVKEELVAYLLEPKKPERNKRPRCKNNKTYHDQLKGNSRLLNSNVASPLSSNNSLDTSLHKQLHKKSDNNVSKLWEVFQIKQDSGKTSNKTAYCRDEIPSYNEGKNMLASSISSQCTEKSRAHKNKIITTMKFLPTDDPT